MALTKLQADVIEGVLGLTWQSPAKTSSFAAAIGNGYYLNTTTGSITVTLPSSPTIGDSIGIIDYAGTAASNTIILTSSNNIQGSSDDKVVNYTRGALRITYADTTQGWVASAAANEGTSALNPNNFLVNYLVVAGGGSGGGGYSGAAGGGGGAGGLKTTTTYSGSETPLAASIGTLYDVTVGTGGYGTTGNGQSGNPGNNSEFNGIISTGGGYGGTVNSYTCVAHGGPGGSGGGGGRGNGGTATPAGQGNAGGIGQCSTAAAAGGGGAGAIGANGIASGNGIGGDGGAGLEVNIIGGTGNYYAGGGGGCGTQNNYTPPAGAGGIGGGGFGSWTDPAGVGTANTGGGGGGMAGGFSGAGGSGIVILRYPTADVSSYAVTGTLDTVADTAYPIANTAYYKLNGNANDSSGNGYNGTASNITYAAGRFGNAAVFNGTSEIVAANSILPSSGGFAISWWQKTTQADNTYSYTIDTGGASLGNGLYISTHRTDVGLQFGFKNGSTFGSSIIPYSSAERTQWTHFCFSWDGTTSANAFKMYKNNVATSFTSTVTNNGSAYPFRIGRSYNGTDYFGGSIDQVRIFSTALTAGNVTSLYNEGTVVESTDGTDSILKFIGGTGTITFS
jgi:hypothetical protein